MRKQPELKVRTLSMSGVGFELPLEALAAMQIVGVVSENVRGSRKFAQINLAMLSH